MSNFEIRNVKASENGMYECEWNHPRFGWIPFLAGANDSEEHGRKIHAEIKEGLHGKIAKYIEPKIDVIKPSAIARIDSDVDVIYGAVVGNRATEYEAAEREAKAYADAGYTGNAGMLVKSWAIAKGWSDEEATDDILAQAANWRGVMAAIRTQRLVSKEAIRSASNKSEFDSALSAWNSFVAQMRSNLGI